MAQQPNQYNDGQWQQGFNYGADKVTYPFLNYPTRDNVTKVYESSRAVIMANYAPQLSGATYSGNPNAYLVYETDVEIDTMARARYKVTYAMVPTNQVQGISRSITRPQPRSVFISNAITISTSQMPVQYRNNATNASVDGSYIGNCIVSATVGQLFAPAYNISSTDGTFVTVGATAGFNSANSLSVIAYAPQFNSYAMLIYPTGQWSITNSTTLNIAPGSPSANLAVLAAPYLKKYSPGTPTVRANQIESFYLPGVTAGINTFADIPLPTIISNDVDYFNALSSNAPNLASNSVVYDYDGPVVWMGNIYKVKQWKINCNDL